MDHVFPIPRAGDRPIPMIGFGTYLIPNDDASAVIGKAMELGYRHIDTAEGYANESGIGDALRRVSTQLGLTREDLFITTKLWPGNPQWGQTPKTYDTTLASLDQSLGKLGLDYVDLYLIHAPFQPQERLEQWRGLVELQKQGKARMIGVSNFNETHIHELESAGFPLPAVNQIELHPWSQKPELVHFLKQKDIVPMAYSSLVPLSSWRDREDQGSAKTQQMVEDGHWKNAPFKRMAVKYNVSESQLLLRWGLQKGFPVIPKSTNPERMQKNLDLFGFSIDARDMAEIANMDRGDGVAWATGDPLKTV